jgi:hypothetical protein
MLLDSDGTSQIAVLDKCFGRINVNWADDRSENDLRITAVKVLAVRIVMPLFERGTVR